MLFSHPSTPDQAITKETPMVQTVKDGSIASSVLLTGKVTANQEQYVYFDGTKGDLQSIFCQCRRSRPVSQLFSIAVQRPKPLMMQPFVLSIRQIVS